MLKSVKHGHRLLHTGVRGQRPLFEVQNPLAAQRAAFLRNIMLIRDLVRSQFGNTFKTNSVLTVGHALCLRKAHTAFIDRQDNIFVVFIFLTKFTPHGIDF
jgi:hypothetical protein